jgi:hypothetical protein
MKRVSIMQPTYLPWCGYFGLIQSVDLFIFLDSVQFERRSWQQRNRIKTASGPRWLTIPVVSKGKRHQIIRDVAIDNHDNFADKHLKAIELNYKNAPYFNTVFPEIEQILNISAKNNLADTTIDLIFCLKRLLGNNTPMMRSSDLTANGTKAELLSSFCEQVDATEYLAPPGSRGYLESSDAFEKLGITVRYLSFHHPIYPQLFGDFLPYMSCLDMLFNCGSQAPSLIKGASSCSK